MYTLTLTREDRKAIDWVGHRYAHGDDLYHQLIDAIVETKMPWNEESWESPATITFRIPEHVAWEISEIIDTDNLACFADSLRAKLYAFQEELV